MSTVPFAAVNDTLEAEDFIYDDEEDAEDGELGFLESYQQQEQETRGYSRHRGNHRLLDAVDGAKSAAEIEAALEEQDCQDMEHRPQVKHHFIGYMLLSLNVAHLFGSWISMKVEGACSSRGLSRRAARLSL